MKTGYSAVSMWKETFGYWCRRSFYVLVSCIKLRIGVVSFLECGEKLSHNIQPEDVRNKYHSDYGVIADYLAYYKDRSALEGHLKSDTRKLIHVEQVLDMLEAFSDDRRFDMIKRQYIENDNKKECDNMCLFLDICEERGTERGMKQGKREQLVMQSCRKIMKGKSIDVITEELEENWKT